MTNKEWRIMDRLGSQLQHFVDDDGKWASMPELYQLLDDTEKILSDNRGRLIQERDYGHQQSKN